MLWGGRLEGMQRAPFKLQLAIQGGGAKLSALVAALEAVQKLEQEGILKVTRIAGTSAGAIAGSLFAARVSMVDVRQYLRSLSGSLQENIPIPSRFKVAYALAFGKAVWSDIWVKEHLAKLLTKSKLKQSPTKFSELDIPMIAIATDIKNGGPVRREGSFNLLNGVLDSCALPFAFRAAHSGGDSIILDGGICEILPADFLDTNDHDYGPVVGVSFKRTAGNTPHSVLSFAARLLDAAINNSMERAKSKLGTAIFEIPTEISTFDFNNAFTKGLQEDYEPIRDEATSFFRSFVEIEQAKRHSAIERQQKLRGDPWIASSGGDHWAKEYTSLMKHIWLMYTTQHATQPIQYVTGRLIVTARSLNGGNFADELESTFLFHTSERLFCHAIKLSHGPSPNHLEETEIRVSQGDTMLRTLIMPMDSTSGGEVVAGSVDLNPRDLLLCFVPPLEPGESAPYSIQYKDVVRDVLQPLLTRHRDELYVRIMRSETPMPRIDLVLHVPSTCRGVRMVPKSESSTFPVPGRRMNDSELNRYIQSAPPGFRTLGWIGNNVPSSKYFGVDLFDDKE